MELDFVHILASLHCSQSLPRICGCLGWKRPSCPSLRGSRALLCGQCRILGLRISCPSNRADSYCFYPFHESAGLCLDLGGGKASCSSPRGLKLLLNVKRRSGSGWSFLPVPTKRNPLQSLTLPVVLLTSTYWTCMEEKLERGSQEFYTLMLAHTCPLRIH